MIIDKKSITEEILGTKDLANSEKVDELRLRRIATWETPFIEYAYQNVSNNNTIAFYYPDTMQGSGICIKRVLEALSRYDVCIVAFSATNLLEANEFCDDLDTKGLATLQIGVVVYDKNGKTLFIRQYVLSDTSSKKRSKSERKSYWCWWRDASQYEIAQLLRLSKEYDDLDGDIYTQKVYPIFYDLMINQKTKQWDGSPRKKNYSLASFKAEKQNYKIPMCQLGLWDTATGHITPKGNGLLDIIDRYGDGSGQYLDYLSKLLLIEGKHLDLIKDVDDFQHNCSELMPENSSDYFLIFDNYMEEKGSIGTRKPSAVTTGGKHSYIRDEPKLWNKLGLIISSGKGRYYWPFVGIKINWPRINEILLSANNGNESI